MSVTNRVATLALVAVLVAAAVAGGAETIKRVLPENGLTVILQENHTAPVVNLRLYVKAGSIYEEEYLGAGISHYCEHLLSDGTTNRTLEEIEEETDAIGGGANAYTTTDHTCYFIETSAEHFDKALDILSDEGMNATLPQEAVDTQRGIITREINMGYDEPSRRVYYMLAEAMFRHHPAKYPVIGYVENFLRLTRDDVLAYHERMYVPNNMVFVAVGDFDAEAAYEKIREAFKEFERKPIDIPALRPEPEQLGGNVLRDQKDIDMAYVRVGFHTVRLSHPDLYPLDVLSYVLSEGQSSRLYRKLVDELGLVYGVSTASHTPAYDAGVFSISMALDPANIDAAIEAVKEEIYRLKDEKVSRKEIDKAKKLKAAEFYFGRQDIESIASSLGTSELSSGNPDFDALYVDNIQKVTAEEIREVVGKYFHDDNMGVAILEPISEGETAEARETEKPDVGPVERHVLDNGLTVLVKRNATNPIVTLGSYTLAGVRFEDPARNGVANFVATMMPRGTKKRSAAKIAEAIDSMGATYGCSANHTRIQSQMTVLKEDLTEGFQLFADMLMNPRFDETEMEKQRELIEASILARADDWNTDAMDRMIAALYTRHPYGRPPTGTMETLASITRDDLVRHHESYVTPGATVVTVFGDVTSEEAMALAKKAFGKWKGQERPVPREYDDPAPREPEVATSYHDRAQTVIFMGYRGMPYSADDRYAMAVLDAVTSGIGYPGGWLHTDLRGNQLVYVVHAYNWTGLDVGYFGIYAATYDEALDQAMEIINGHMERITQELVSDEEIDEAKRLCVIMNETQKQTNAALSHDAAIPELYGLGYGYEDDYSARIKEVTKEDVLRVAQKYLKNPVTIIRRPNPDEHASAE